MKGRLIVIEPGPPGMAALVVDGRLEDLLIDPPAEEATPKSRKFTACACAG